MSETTALPPALAEIVDDFAAVPDPEKLELLLEFSDELPELPSRYDGHEEEMEQVVECQSPLFLAVELEGAEEQAAGPESWSACSSPLPRRRRPPAASPPCCPRGLTA